MSFKYDSRGRIISEGDGFNDPYVEYRWMSCDHNDESGCCDDCDTCSDCCTCEN